MLSAVKLAVAGILTRKAGCAASDLALVFKTEALLGDWNFTRRTGSFVALLLASVLSTVNHLVTRAFAGKLSSLGHMAGHLLSLLFTVTLIRNVDVAGRTGTRVTEHVTSVVLAVLVLQLFAVVAARVRKNHGIIVWLFEATTETGVPWQVVLSVAVVAVRAGPAEEGHQLLGLPVRFGVLSLVFFSVVVRTVILRVAIFSLLSFLLSYVLLQAFVELLDPPLDAAQVERLAALLAVPERAFLVDLILADDTFLRAFRKTLDKEGALLG